MKILFLGANSLDTPQLQIPAELRDVKEEFERAAKRQDIDVRAELAVRPTDLSRLLLGYRPDIVHFSGHGMELRVRTGTTSGTTREFDLPDDSASQDTSSESAILFENSAGHAVLVPLPQPPTPAHPHGVRLIPLQTRRFLQSALLGQR
jgi:hypothetical protein